MTTRKELMRSQIQGFSARLGAAKPVTPAVPDVPRWKNGEARAVEVRLQEKIKALEEVVDPERLEHEPGWAQQVMQPLRELIVAREALTTETSQRESNERALGKAKAAFEYREQQRAASEVQKDDSEAKRQEAVDLYYKTGGQSPMPS